MLDGQRGEGRATLQTAAIQGERIAIAAGSIDINVRRVHSSPRQRIRLSLPPDEPGHDMIIASRVCGLPGLGRPRFQRAVGAALGQAQPGMTGTRI